MKLQYIFALVLVGLLLFGCAQGKGAGTTSAGQSPASGQVGEITEADLPDIDDPELGEDLEGSDLSVE